MPELSPLVAQHEFAARIRAQRERLGLGTAEVAKHLGFSRNFYSAIENCRAVLSPAKVDRLVDLLQLSGPEAGRLSELLAEAKRPGWWQRYASVLDDGFVRYLGLECAASVVNSYESRVFSGLLQSPEYARNVIGASPNISAVRIQQSLEARNRRQEEMFRQDPLPELTFVFTEALLWQQYGGVDVLRAQLRHVLGLAEKFGERLQLRLQTFEVTPLGLGSASTLVLLDFENPHLAPVVYREAGSPIGVSDDAALVSKLALHYKLALSSSAGPDATLRLIERRLANIKG